MGGSIGNNHGIEELIHKRMETAEEIPTPQKSEILGKGKILRQKLLL